MTRFHTLQATALGLFFATSTFTAFAEVEVEKTGWQTPLAAEFSRLDTSGNGLLKPNEATRGNAFNKKTFAQADQDHDGYIDQNEYIYFKTGAWPETMQAPQATVPVAAPPVTTQPEEMPAEIVPPKDDLSLYDLNDEGMSAELQSLIDAHEQALVQAQEKANGSANQDHMINAKAIKSILSTDDLEGVQISVATYEGEVMLNGFVNSQEDKMKAEYVVSKIDGVKAVINDLVVRS